MTPGKLEKTIKNLRALQRNLRAEKEASEEGTAPVDLDPEVFLCLDCAQRAEKRK